MEPDIPYTTFDFKFLHKISENPELVRNLAFIGDMHCGKTTLCDLFIRHTNVFSNGKIIPRFTDSRNDE